MVLIDTSAWIEALRRTGDAVTRATVREAVIEGEARLCPLVLLELWHGARGTAELGLLRQIEAEVECLPMHAEVWAAANGLARTLRLKGITVPATDIAIAACARHHGAALLHRDDDFNLIAGTR